MHVSVIVPFYNAEAFIEQCIQGLLAQAYPSEAYELLFVDNNSTDASASIVRRYPRVRLLSEARQGAYAARNRGLKAAHGPIIAFTDPDCVPEPNWLQHLVSAMRSPDTRIVIGGYCPPPTPLLALLSRYESERDQYFFGGDDGDFYYGHTNNMAVCRTLFDEVGPFLERPRGSDTRLVRQAVRAFSVDAVRYAPEARVQHLEVDRLSVFYRKRFIYGKSCYLHQRDGVAGRPLTAREYLRLFRRTVRGSGSSLATSGLLFLLLAAGWASYTAGYWYAAVGPGPDAAHAPSLAGAQPPTNPTEHTSSPQSPLSTDSDTVT